MDNHDITQFFSISNQIILTESPLPYDIYINSSKRPGKNRFVKVVSKGAVLSGEYWGELQSKYMRFYLPESQRLLFLKTIANSNHLEDVGKVDVIKDSAMAYLGSLFDQSKEFNTALLEETITACHSTVEHLVDILRGRDISDLQQLIARLSFHDFYTYDHSINVGMYSVAILKTMRPDASREELVNCGLGGLLHDLGKIKISTSIINKMGALSASEFSEIKKHPQFGFDEICREQGVNCPQVDLEVLGRVIHEHHENFDGTGYPQRLKQQQIHLYARICAAADFFDAITTKRSYNQVLDTSEAIDVIGCTVGKRIDPEVFDALQSIVKESRPKGRKILELEQDFDPERPFESLPLKPSQNSWAQAAEGFGKVIVIDDSPLGGKKKRSPGKGGKKAA